MCERLGPVRELKVPIIIIKMIIKKVAQDTKVIDLARSSNEPFPPTSHTGA